MKAFHDFVDAFKNKRLAILELDVENRNPLVKQNLLHAAFAVSDSTYIVVNIGYVFIPPELANRSIVLEGDLKHTLKVLNDALS